MKNNYLVSILILCLTFEVRAQQIQITGTVTSSEDKAGLPGVNVIVQGTSTGTVTDVDGTYALEVAGESAVLVFSSVGYLQEEVTVGSRTLINMVMSPDITSLEEIVVVGYGTMKKSDLTGSLTSVSADDYQLQPITRIDQALQGRAAGVTVTQTSGAPGAGYKIRIRGANSISGNNAPLYVIDGLVVGDMNSINVNDIASMEVLKDASATAIYGSRGANGVVLITTKSGGKGPAKIEVETFYGVSKVTQKLPVMTPAEFAEGVNFAEGTEFYTSDEIADLRNGGGEDWHERFFREAPFSNLQLSVSGGSDAINYFVSGNLYNADGTLRNQNYKRYSVRTNINATLSKKIGVGLNAYFSREEETGVRANLYQGLTWDPTTPAFNETGDYNFVPLKPGVGNGAINQLVAPENNVRENFNHQIIANGYFKYNFRDDLELNVSGGLERLDRNNNSYTSILVNQIGAAKVFNQGITRLQNTNRLTYTWNKNSNHRLQIDAIHEQQFVKAQGTEAEASGFFSDNTTYKNLGLGAIQRTTSKAYPNGTNNPVSESLQSFLGRVNYSLFDKFLFTASIRADASSKFAENSRWGYFPSGSFAYRISDEAFIQGIEIIDDLKLRVSFGQIGSQAIEPLTRRAIPIIDTIVNYPFEGEASTIGVAPSNRLANPDLTWETTTQGNIGFDIGLWDSKLTLSLDLYQKKTTDLLLDRVLPSYVGPTVVTQNVGEVENKGFDLRLGATILDTDDWHVSSILSVSKNNNKVLALVDDIELMELGLVYQTNTFPVNPTAVQLGKPISTFRGYVFEGVYQLGEEDEAARYGKVPGQARYKDINGDTLITSDDIVTVGDGNPDFTWGWNWTVSWKKFDLNFLLLGSHGNDIYNFTRMRMMGLGAAQFHAVHADYNNRWTPSNPSEIPSGRDGTEFLSSQFIEDGSFVSMKNITLGYNFDFPGNNFIESLRIYASAENLFIITDYTGFDPEATASGSSDVDLGIDLNAYPINRSYSVGLKFMF
ncbi:TonB-dependent receptor [Fulvivirgaceae bacterium BMA12]|uniref:TonB-dependent receptor n=1 Tax=Agaribacillus aureus TaxID=3051825 RepID=A0ABT8L5G5_9BACT|nr:TonB-dependent receptor [Fulvivirgaceae bacterium BMA12]